MRCKQENDHILKYNYK